MTADIGKKVFGLSIFLAGMVLISTAYAHTPPPVPHKRATLIVSPWRWPEGGKLSNAGEDEMIELSNNHQYKHFLYRQFNWDNVPEVTIQGFEQEITSGKWGLVHINSHGHAGNIPIQVYPLTPAGKDASLAAWNALSNIYTPGVEITWGECLDGYGIAITSEFVTNRLLGDFHVEQSIIFLAACGSAADPDGGGPRVSLADAFAAPNGFSNSFGYSGLTVENINAHDTKVIFWSMAGKLLLDPQDGNGARRENHTILDAWDHGQSLLGGGMQGRSGNLRRGDYTEDDVVLYNSPRVLMTNLYFSGEDMRHYYLYEDWEDYPYDLFDYPNTGTGQGSYEHDIKPLKAGDVNLIVRFSKNMDYNWNQTAFKIDPQLALGAGPIAFNGAWSVAPPVEQFGRAMWEGTATIPAGNGPNIDGIASIRITVRDIFQDAVSPDENDELDTDGDGKSEAHDNNGIDLTLRVHIDTTKPKINRAP